MSEPDKTGARAELDALHTRLQTARRARKSGSDMQSAAKAKGNALELAYRVLAEIIAGIAIGGYMGYWLDKWLDTRPIFLVAFLLLGMCAGLLTAMRTLARTGNKSMEAKEE